MKLSRLFVACSFAAALTPVVFAQTSGRAPVIRAGGPSASGGMLPASTEAAAATYSTELPFVQRFAPADNGESNTLVLNAAHSFSVTLAARDPRSGNTGPGVALKQSDVFGYFSIPALTQNPSNPEVFVKVLDATAIPGQGYWIFGGFLTDLIFDLTVTEDGTGRSRTFHKDAGQQLNFFDTTTFTPTAGVTARHTSAIQETPNAFVRTAVDISNHTPASITADIQYTYKCTSAACSPVGGFYNTAVRRINLGAFGNFHDDDIVDLLDSQGVLQPGANQGSIGTLLITFNGLPGNVGWEATAQANTYNRISEPDELRGTVGYGMNGSLFFESTNTSVTATVRDTRVTPGLEGDLLTNVGIRNTDIVGTNANVNVDLSLYDPDSGARIGNVVQLNGIAPGEVRVVEDLYTAAGVGNANKSLILFADVRNRTPSSPTIEGFVLIQDFRSLDSRFHEMKCGDPTGHCGGL